MTTTITIRGIGSVVVDLDSGTLQPSTHVVGQRIGVGYSFNDSAKAEADRSRRDSFEDAASEKFGTPEYEWIWRDHNGSHV